MPVISSLDFAVIQAAQAGCLATLSKMVKTNADVDLNAKAPPFGRTALMEAAIRGNDTCVTALLEAGSDPRVKDDFGNTALMHAILHDRAAVFEQFLRAKTEYDMDETFGGGISIRNFHGNSPAMRRVVKRECIRQEMVLSEALANTLPKELLWLTIDYCTTLTLDNDAEVLLNEALKEEVAAEGLDVETPEGEQKFQSKYQKVLDVTNQVASPEARADSVAAQRRRSSEAVRVRPVPQFGALGPRTLNPEGRRARDFRPAPSYGEFRGITGVPVDLFAPPHWETRRAGAGGGTGIEGGDSSSTAGPATATSASGPRSPFGLSMEPSASGAGAGFSSGPATSARLFGSRSGAGFSFGAQQGRRSRESEEEQLALAIALSLSESYA